MTLNKKEPETFELTLVPEFGNNAVAIGDQDTTTVSIIDNDVAYLEFESATYSGTEQDNTASSNFIAITVTRSGLTDIPVNAEIQIGNGSASEFNDFYIFDPWVNFEAGETSKTIYVEINDDSELEGTETIEFQLVSNGNPDIAIGQQSTTTLSIFDNENSQYFL